MFPSQAGPGLFSAALNDDSRTDLNEVKGHLEIALLEKHFLREYYGFVNYLRPRTWSELLLDWLSAQQGSNALQHNRTLGNLSKPARQFYVRHTHSY